MVLPHSGCYVSMKRAKEVCLISLLCNQHFPENKTLTLMQLLSFLQENYLLIDSLVMVTIKVPHINCSLLMVWVLK